MRTRAIQTFILSSLYCVLGKVGVGFGQTILSFLCRTVSIGLGVGRFVPIVMVVERGGTVKTFQREPLCMREKTVLPGINHLKNALQSCAVEMHLEVKKLKLVGNGGGGGHYHSRVCEAV